MKSHGLRSLLMAAAAVAFMAICGCDRAPDKGTDRSQTTDATPFVDNADGTVTDLMTGLVWEKKCDCPDTPHHYDAMYFWSGDGAHETIWDWLEALNEEGAQGFAGHGDWRIPNVKELVSLVDYERAEPAIAAVFDACETECPTPAGSSCGCTASGRYWTATTFADFPAHALAVNSGVGVVDDQLKTLRGFVRAVRGPLEPTAREPSSAAPR